MEIAPVQRSASYPCRAVWHLGSMESLSWVATQTLVPSFPGGEQLLHIASGRSPSVFVEAEPVLKKQMDS